LLGLLNGRAQRCRIPQHAEKNLGNRSIRIATAFRLREEEARTS
jgi:hypothetical protein